MLAAKNIFAADGKGGESMKTQIQAKRWKLITIFVVVFILSVIICDVCCVKNDTTVIYDQENEKITVNTGTEIINDVFVRDYVEGDSCGLVPKKVARTKDIIGIFVVQPPFEKEAENKAVLSNGKIITLDTHLKLLPRGDGEFVLTEKDNFKVTMNLSGKKDYQISIEKGNKTIVERGVILDAWVTDDGITYWMVNDNYQTVYKFNPETDEAAIMYAANTIGVSHHSGKAQGALMQREEAANSVYHGRNDLRTLNPNLPEESE